jgi:ribonuclease HI
LYFDGSKSQEGVRSKCLLIDLNQKCILSFYKHKFECTKKTVEYEALVQGLKNALGLIDKCIKFFGDYEIIVQRVRNSIHCHSPHLKNYQLEVWILMNTCEAFNIKSIPWNMNEDVDSLANTTS